MPRPWERYSGLTYLLLVLFLPLNVPLVAFGLPSSRWMLQEAGGHGLALTAGVGAVVVVAAALSHSVDRAQWRFAAAIAAWSGGSALSMLVLGSTTDVRYLYVAMTTTAVSIASALLTPAMTRALFVAAGWLFGWLSVAAGISDLLWDWPRVLVADPRLGDLMSSLGLQTAGLGVLNGLSPGRVFLAMNCAVVLVYLVRLRPNRRHHVVVCVGLAATLLWSFGRVGLLAVTLGFILTLFPWERLRSVWLFSALLAIPVLPLVGSRLVQVSDATGQWRFDLWWTYLDNSALWSPFGLGPQAPADPIRGHAHNQVLESLASGGLVSLLGFLAFLWLASSAALRVARSDNRVTMAVAFAASGIFATDVLTFGGSSTVVNSALVLVIIVIAGAMRQPVKATMSP